MKYLRTFILVLLTILLPIRGAVAAAMLCPGGTATVDAEVNAAPGAHGGEGANSAAADHEAIHDHSNHSHGDASDEASSGGHGTACQFCAGGGCCVTPLAFAPPSVGLPGLVASTTFPLFTARVTAFYPDGQDRPPRTF